MNYRIPPGYEALAEAAVRYREALEAILKLNGSNDLPDAWTIARKALRGG